MRNANAPNIMKRLFLISLITLWAFKPDPQQNAFKTLGMLSGNWQMKTAKGILGERWKKISENELQNQGYKITGNDTAKLEHVSLVQKREEIYYISTVANENDGKAIPFKLTKSKNSQFVFSNPEHDFPQNITYEIVSKDSVHAWIDGTYKGKYGRKDFYYKRVHD